MARPRRASNCINPGPRLRQPSLKRPACQERAGRWGVPGPRRDRRETALGMVPHSRRPSMWRSDPPHQEFTRGPAASSLWTTSSTTSSPDRPPAWSTGPTPRRDARRRRRPRRPSPTQMREAEHAADETTHEIVRAGQRARSSRRSTARTSTRLASGLDDVMDFMEEAVDLVVSTRSSELPDGARRPGRGAPALRRADRRGDAAAAVDEGPRGVLDRDQPAGERRRPDLPADPGQAVQRRVRRAEVLKLKEIVDSLEARDRRLREGRQHRRADRVKES